MRPIENKRQFILPDFSIFKLKVGIIGGTGFIKDSDIMTETKEINIATTPFGNPSDVLLEGNINGVSCVILSR